MSGSKISTRLGWSSLGLVSILLAFWLASALGAAPPVGLSRSAALLSLLSASLWGSAHVLCIIAGRTDKATDARWLLFLTLSSIAIYWAGVGHEIEGYYYWDEGTYAKHASQINGGELLFPTFVYPHLVYYADAFVQWLAGLVPEETQTWILQSAELSRWAVLLRLLYRLVVATCGALTVVPVFLAARSVAGPLAARIAGAAMLLSPVFLFGSKLNTCDIPSAFFAGLCLYPVARLTERESYRSYAFAGLAAGLAAGAKYPAGLVAAAIVVVWLYWRVSQRNWHSGLFAAAAASLATFVATTPSLLAFPQAAISSPRSVFFGVDQYTSEGWVGVIQDNNTLYYLGLLLGSFGIPLGGLALVGLAVSSPEVRRRALLLSGFPLVYLSMLAITTVVVERNVYPIVPAAAVFAGIGVAGLIAAARLRLPDRRLPVAAVIAATAVVALASPLYRTLLLDTGYVRQSTRDVAQAWLAQHIPPGSMVYKERYTPNVNRTLNGVVERRFGPRLAFGDLNAGWDYVLLADRSYRRWFEPNVAGVEHHGAFQDWYRQVFENFELMAEFSPGWITLGPVVRVYRIPPLDREGFAGSRRFGSEELFRPGRKRAKANSAIGFRNGGGWFIVKAPLRAGSYRLALDGDVAGPAEVAVVDSTNHEVARLALTTDGTDSFELPVNDRYHFQLLVPKGSWFEAVEIVSAQ